MPKTFSLVGRRKANCQPCPTSPGPIVLATATNILCGTLLESKVSPVTDGRYYYVLRFNIHTPDISMYDDSLCILLQSGEK